MSDWYDDINMKGVSKILNLPAPSTDTEPARRIDLNNAIEGLKQKDPVRVASVSNITLASPGATINGVTMASLDRVLIKDQTAQAENGIYIWNGATSAMTRSADASTAAELNSALVPIREGSTSGSTWRQTATIVTLGTDVVTFVQFGTTAAQATESAAGIAQIALQSEVDAGTVDTDMVTPLKLANWSGRKRKAAATYGDNTATQFDIVHNFGTLEVHIATYRVSTGERVYPKERAFDANTVRLNFTLAPTASEFKTVVSA